MGLSVIGAGFGRTGTMSTKYALEALGVAPCYHMMEVANHPGHPALWARATRGEAVDWRALFHGYHAAVDWPASTFWQDIARAFPQAKILLTVRDPERWYDSVSQTIFQSLSSPEATEDGPRRERRIMANELILQRTFDGRFADRAHAIDVYERHIALVKEHADPSRLLVYDVSEGWPPLCAFLGVPIPNDPFPRLNSTQEFKDRVTARGENKS